MAFCVLVAGLSVGVVLGELRSQFHIDGVVAALHGCTFGVGLLVCGTFAVRLVDRIGRRAALGLAASSIAIGITLFCLGPIWPITLLGTAFSGFGGALTVMVMPGLMSDHHGPNRAAAFSAINGVPGLAGLMFSLVIGAALAAGLSWRAPYLILTAMFFIAFIIVGRPVAVPEGTRDADFSLAPLRTRRVVTPWLHIVNAVLTEFTVGIWGVTYLHEVGKAGSGQAAVLASVFGVMMFVVRLKVHVLMRWFGEATVSVSFVIAAIGATLMCFGPSLALRVVGLAVVGFGGAPLYPLTVDRLYASVGHELDSVTLGAYCALASGVAVTIGPVLLGVVADAVGLRWAILIVPVLALIGAATQRPRADTVRSYSVY